MATVAYPHIEITEAGEPKIAGTRIKVIHLAMAWLAHHWDAHEMQRQYEGLTLGQIHSAMAYYFDHQEEMNRAIAALEKRADELHAERGNARLEIKLRTVKTGA